MQQMLQCLSKAFEYRDYSRGWIPPQFLFIMMKEREAVAQILLSFHMKL